MEIKNRINRLATSALVGLAVVGLVAFAITEVRGVGSGTINPGLFGANDNGVVAQVSLTNAIVGQTTNIINPYGGTNQGITTTASATASASVGAFGIPVDVSLFDNVGIGFTASNAYGSAATVTFRLQRSMDGVLFETATNIAPLSFTVSVPAGTNVVFYTNLNYDTIGSVAALRVAALENTTVAVNVTNPLVYIGTKRKASGR